MSFSSVDINSVSRMTRMRIQVPSYKQCFSMLFKQIIYKMVSRVLVAESWKLRKWMCPKWTVRKLWMLTKSDVIESENFSRQEFHEFSSTFISCELIEANFTCRRWESRRNSAAIRRNKSRLSLPDPHVENFTREKSNAWEIFLASLTDCLWGGVS